jgi:hypothetical protein
MTRRAEHRPARSEVVPTAVAKLGGNLLRRAPRVTAGRHLGNDSRGAG